MSNAGASMLAGLEEASMQRMGDGRRPVAHRVVLTAGLMALAGAVPARRSVKVAGASFALVVALMSALWLAPFAGAVPTMCPDDNPSCQSDIPDVPDNPDTGGPGDVGDVTDPIEDTTDPITDPIEDTTDPITDPIEDTTDPITDPIEDTTDPITDPIEDTTDPITDPIEDTIDPILEDDSGWDVPDTEEILKPELPSLEEPIDDGLKDLDKTVDKIGSTERPSGAIDSDPVKLEQAGPIPSQDPPNDDGDKSSDKTPTGSDAESPALAGFSEARSSSGAPADSERDLDVALAADEELQPGLFGRVGEVSVEVAKKLAFPLALLVLVAAFLLIHNRIDRKDPKLAHAPVSAENESLTFE